jgi:Lipoprotein amino terminal region
MGGALRVFLGSGTGVAWAGCIATILAVSGCQSAQPNREQPSTVVNPTAPQWQSGTRYVYATSLASRLSVASTSSVAFSMSAELRLETRATNKDTKFLLQLKHVKFQAENPAAQPQFDQLVTELSQPFGFVTSGGALSAVQLPAVWSPFAVSIARTLAAGFQFVDRSEQQTGSSWSARLIDATGAYDVEYTPGEGKSIGTRKTSYASLSLGKIALANFDATVTPRVIESKGSVVLGDPPVGPRLTAVQYRERVSMQLTPTSLAESETQLGLTLTGSEQLAVPLDWATALEGTKKYRPDEVVTRPTPSATYDINRIGDYTFKKALTELEAQARDPHGSELLSSVDDQPFDAAHLKERETKLQAEGRSFSALAALIRTDPRNVPLTVARIRAHSPASHALSDALSSAGTPEAQQALVALSNDAKLELRVRRTAAFSLTRTDPATPDTVRSLEAHVGSVDPLRVYALFGLGTIARRLRDRGLTERSEAIVSGLEQDLKQAATPPERVEVLRAIANSGAASAFNEIKPYLQATEVPVQAAAVDALRLMARPEVDGIIAAMLAHSDTTLQGAALNALSVREPSVVLVAALTEVAKSATNPALRIRAVRVMGRWLPQRPELRSNLEALAQSDSLDQIRDEARKALGSSPHQAG